MTPPRCSWRSSPSSALLRATRPRRPPRTRREPSSSRPSVTGSCASARTRRWCSSWTICMPRTNLPRRCSRSWLTTRATSGCSSSPRSIPARRRRLRRRRGCSSSLPTASPSLRSRRRSRTSSCARSSATAPTSGCSLTASTVWPAAIRATPWSFRSTSSIATSFVSSAARGRCQGPSTRAICRARWPRPSTCASPPSRARRETSRARCRSPRGRRSPPRSSHFSRRRERRRACPRSSTSCSARTSCGPRAIASGSRRKGGLAPCRRGSPPNIHVRCTCGSAGSSRAARRTSSGTGCT